MSKLITERGRRLSLMSCLALACVSNSTEAPGVTSPVELPSVPDLSSPLRFRPSIIGFAASAQTVRVGGRVRLTARVNPSVPTAVPMTWQLVIDPASTGVATLSTLCGTGDIEATLDASYRGPVTVRAYAMDLWGRTARSVSLTITVER